MLPRKYTESEQKKLLQTMTILVDTREKKGKNDHILNWFDKNNIPWIKRKLNTGDYSLFLPANPDLDILEDISFESQIMVERKANLAEIAGNLCADKGKRIRTEFSKAPSSKVLLIEGGSFSKLVNGKYDSELNPKSFLALLLSMWHKYNIPVFFIPDNSYSGQFIYSYLYYYLKGILK